MLSGWGLVRYGNGQRMEEMDLYEIIFVETIYGAKERQNVSMRRTK